MSKLETVLVGVFVGAACPLLAFVGCWWSAAVLHMHIPEVPLSAVIASALTGLCLGVLLDVFLLRRWVRRFYQASVWLMAMLFLSLDVVAVGFFMGLPLGTLALGTLAGLYMGRRARHAGRGPSRAVDSVRVTALTAAAATAAAAFPIGIIAIRERDIAIFLGSLTALSPDDLRGLGGMALIGLLCAVLFLLQYGLARNAGLVAYRLGGLTSGEEP